MSIARITFSLLAVLIVGGFIIIGAKDAAKTRDLENFQKIELKGTQSEIKQLDLEVNKLNQDLDKASQQKNVDSAEVERLKKEKEELDRQKQELERQLQAKLEHKSKLAQASENAVNVATATQTVAAASYSDSIDCYNITSAKAFMYCKESGNRPHAYNELGCRGLGQACPGSKLPCGDHDYACQDAWFTNYMVQRYGTWEKAKAHWLARVPINGKDVGHWW